MSFTKVLSLCERCGFLKQTNGILKLGPTGTLLQENLRNEWLFAMVTNRDIPVFLSGTSFSETYIHAKELCLERLPFGIAEIIPKQCIASENASEKTVSFENFFLGEENHLLRCTMFASPSDATQLYYQWQRQRRTWWRKVRFGKHSAKFVTIVGFSLPLHRAGMF